MKFHALNNYIQDLEIYPNPTSDHINIEMFTPNNLISLFDLSGKMIFQKSIHLSNYKLDINKFDAGIYILNISNRFGESNRKLIFTK